MEATPTTASRLTIERTPSGLVVTMPIPRAGCPAAFLSVWLLGWLVGEVGVGATLLGGRTAPGPDTLFAVAWLIAWTAGGVAAASFLALLLAGREIVTLAPDGLRRRVAAFGIGRTTTYVPQEVEDLRVMVDRAGRPVFFGFEYRGRTARWGSGLVGDEAARIVEALKDFGATPQGPSGPRPPGDIGSAPAP